MKWEFVEKTGIFRIDREVLDVYNGKKIYGDYVLLFGTRTPSGNIYWQEVKRSCYKKVVQKVLASRLHKLAKAA